MKNETIETFSAIGNVYGHLWGGGSGAYKCKKLTANTKEELIDLANKMLNDGSLDGGMGFESLIGACLEITCETSINVDGKKFTQKEYDFDFIGKLTEEQEEFLTNLI